MDKKMEKLLKLLQDDAKLTVSQLAVMLNLTEEEVTAAIRKFEKDGVIKGYRTIVNWERTDVHRASALIELREEICKFYKKKYQLSYQPETEVLVTVGGSEAIDMALRCIIGEGEEVIIPEPCFVCYDPLTRMAGGVPVAIQTKAENEFRLTADELENAITEKTKALILPEQSDRCCHAPRASGSADRGHYQARPHCPLR